MSNGVDNDGSNFERRLQQRVVNQSDPLSTVPYDPNLRPRGRIPNSPAAVSTVSFLLGIVCALGLVLFAVAVQNGRSVYRLGFYTAAWAGFHYGEFAVTAAWNREKCSIDSFLLENGMQYHMAHTFAVLEYVIILVILGQFVRSAAMIHAGKSFSHTVAFRKLDDHTLVTDGIYAWFRHPSYAGFFYWALGTQLVLQNPVSFAGFFVVLWRFFSSRIAHEETALIRFFGDDYRNYRKRTGTLIPFV